MSRVNGLERRILHKTGEAIRIFRMISDGDRILVALSGGKDSWTLLNILDLLKKRSPVKFDLIAVIVHPGFKGFRTDILENYLKKRNFNYHIEYSDIYETITSIGADKLTYCAFCSRFRRGILYRLAPSLGCNKIALGHHADDLIETLLLNAFYEGRLETMPAYLQAEDGRNIVIRPLAFVWEKETNEYARQKKLPVICCKCPACKDFNMKRRQVKGMLAGLEESHHGIKKSFLRALQNFSPERLLAPRYYKIPTFS
jgi:tRNA 2-thiocytidine biosynthesis protein TtcA